MRWLLPRGIQSLASRCALRQAARDPHGHAFVQVIAVRAAFDGSRILRTANRWHIFAMDTPGTRRG